MTITLDAITLNPDLQLDPPLYSIDRVEAATAWTRGGAQVRWERLRKSVPINLKGGPDWGGMERSVLAALYATVNAVDQVFTLDYHGTAMTVKWRHEEAPVIECHPISIYRRDEESDNDFFVDIVLKFMWVVA